MLTVLVMAALLLWAVRARRPTPPDGAAPESLVWTLIDAARAGDVDAYLACFDGRLRQRLEATVTEMTREGFADYLRSSSDPLTGVAVYDVARPAPGQASLTVEYVYRDVTERQAMRLAAADGGWKIADLERSRRAKPLIPYGRPAAEPPPPEPTATPPVGP